MTTIEWTQRPGTKGETWNPIRAETLADYWHGDGKTRLGWHCEHVSEGCRNCYAETMNRWRGTGLDFKPGNLPQKISVFLDEKALRQPLSWRKPRTIFVLSMSDLFGKWVEAEWIDRVFAVAALCPQHTFIILTKRPVTMRAYMNAPDRRPRVVDQALWMKELPHHWQWPLRNVWLGVSAEDQETADARIPFLLDTPAAVRWVSCEPLLSPIDLAPYLRRGDADLPDIDPLAATLLRQGKESGHAWVRPALDWIVAGGESGPGARPAHPDWFRSLRDQCQAAGVAFFFKQWGEWAPGVCATQAMTRPEQCAEWLNDGWNFGRVTPQESEGMHRDDEPDLYRIGKKRAGRRLDGEEWTQWPDRPLPNVGEGRGEGANS